jgi:hypothetical protein
MTIRQVNVTYKVLLDHVSAYRLLFDEDEFLRAKPGRADLAAIS